MRKGSLIFLLEASFPNPRLSLVYEGIDLCRREGVDFILAVGGGSVIDSAKAIGYGVENEGDVWDFYERKRQACWMSANRSCTYDCGGRFGDE